MLRTVRSLVVLAGCGTLGLAVASCASAPSEDACGSGALIDGYDGDPSDPYFGGSGGGGVWNDPGYYDPGYGSSASGDPSGGSGYGDTSGGDPGGYGDPSGGVVDNSSGDDGSGDDSSDAKRKLHLRPSDVSLWSTPPDANGCYVCTMACTFIGNSGPAGQAAQGVSSRSEAAACQAAMQTIEASGQSLGQCQANGPSAGTGRTAANPAVSAASQTSPSVPTAPAPATSPVVVRELAFPR